MILTSTYRQAFSAGEMKMKIAKRIAKWFRRLFSASQSEPAERLEQHGPRRRARRWVTLR
jgi:hypothetical protein